MIKQGVLQQNLSCMYHFEPASKVCDQFNRLINTLKREEEGTCNTDKYRWLDDSDERKYMTDKKNTVQIHRPRQLMSNQAGKVKVEKPHL